MGFESIVELADQSKVVPRLVGVRRRTAGRFAARLGGEFNAHLGNNKKSGT